MSTTSYMEPTFQVFAPLNNANFSVTNISNDTLFLYQCVDPPDDSCDFGPCPNPDVTGIGQQISSNYVHHLSTASIEPSPAVYITATVFAITIMHDPGNIKVSAYTFLANLYSLLIAGLISLLQGQLTQNDATFVIVVAVSPASLYIWFTAFAYLFNLVPLRIASRLPDYWERLLLISLSLLSLGLWVVLLVLSMGPVRSVNFSQPACNQEYGKSAIGMMLWSVSFLASSIIGMVYTYVSWKILRKLSMQNTYRDCTPLLDWTRINFRRRFSVAARSIYGMAGMLVLMQIAQMLTLPVDFTMNFQMNSSTLLEALYVFETIKDWIYLAMTVIFAIIFIWAHPVKLRNFRSIFYSIISTLALGSAAAANLLGFGSIISFEALIICSFLGVLSIWEWRDSLSYVPKKSQKERNRKLLSCILKLIICIPPLFTLTLIYPQFAWFALWQPPAVWPSNSRLENVDLAWRYLIDAAPIFKFTYFVLEPTIAWINASMAANPTNSSNMSFGQVFSLITAVVSLGSLVPLIYRNKRRIFYAIWPVEQKSLREGLHAPWSVGRVVGPPSRD